MNQLNPASASAEEDLAEEFLELPHDDLTAFCRLCFSVNQLEPLFASPQDVDYQLINTIEIFTDIKLTVKTDFPSSICLQCRLAAEDFLNFRKLSQKLDRVYRRKRTEMIFKTSEMESEGHEPTPMEVIDENCGIQVTAEPSAMEASTDPTVGAVLADSLIVHELSDDDDVLCTGVTSIETVPIDLGATEEDDEPFLKMANHWFCCKLCSRLYQSFPLLAEHFRDIHPAQSHLMRTKKLEHYYVPESELQLVSVQGRDYFKCDICDTIFTAKRNITRHRWRYHGAFDDCWKTICKVPGCGQFFMERKALGRHMTLIHGKKPYARSQVKKVPPTDDDNDVVVLTDTTEETSAAPPQIYIEQ